jgi:hypothetical protein
MTKRLTLAAAALVIGLLAATVSAQLPGPPVGAPQAIQNASYGYNFQYTFVPQTTTGSGVRIFPTLRLTMATGHNADLLTVGGSIINAGTAGSVTQAAALHVAAPTCTATGGTFTTCANLVVDAAPTGATNNFSAWFKGDVRIGSTVALSTGLTGGSSCGASLAAAGVCANTVTGPFHILVGTYLLAGSTSTVTGISPPFTSATSYNCVANDITTRANPAQAIPASGTSIVIANTTGATDLISVICAGT